VIAATGLDWYYPIMNPMNILVMGPQKDQVAEMEIFVEGSIAPVALAEAAKLATASTPGVVLGQADFGAIAEHRGASSSYKFGTVIRFTFAPLIPTSKAQSIAADVEIALENLSNSSKDTV